MFPDLHVREGTATEHQSDSLPSHGPCFDAPLQNQGGANPCTLRMEDRQIGWFCCDIFVKCPIFREKETYTAISAFMIVTHKLTYLRLNTFINQAPG